MYNTKVWLTVALAIVFLLTPVMGSQNVSQNILLTGVVSRPQELGVWFAGSGAVIPHEASWVCANSPDYVPGNPNLVANSAFEYGQHNWNLYTPLGRTPLRMDIRNGWKDKSGVLINDKLGYGSGLYQYFGDVPPNTLFNYTAMVKTVNIDALQVDVLYYEVRDMQGNSFGGKSSRTIQGSQNWALYETSFRTPNVWTAVSIFPVLVYNKGEVWVDDVYLAMDGWASNENVLTILNWMDLHPAWISTGENPLVSATDLLEIETMLKAVPTENFWGIIFVCEEIYRTHIAFDDNLNIFWFGENLLGYSQYRTYNPNATIDAWKDEMYLRMIRGFHDYFSPLTKVGITWGHVSPAVWNTYYGIPATEFLRENYDFLFLYPYTKNLTDWLNNGIPYLSAVDNLFPNQKKFWILTRIWDSNINTWEEEAIALEMKNCLDRNIVISLYNFNNPPFDRTWALMLKAIELYNNRVTYFEEYIYGKNMLTGYEGKTYGWVKLP